MVVLPTSFSQLHKCLGILILKQPIPVV